MTKEEILQKLTSRKFWIATAAGLASIGGSIAGMATDNTDMVTTGMVCTMLSAAIYAAAEAYDRPAGAASLDTSTELVTTGELTATTSDVPLPFMTPTRRRRPNA